ncbi:hypothetical protein niasHT_024366 [Heterodera trifolii]|uniref:AAA+ ATPase domain-containing protein n=1 Tax=Heterodera trifolii TaxID=157864 RepID=A0ABD2JY25_9BILA
MLVGREPEFIKLESLLSSALGACADCDAVDEPKPLSVYICGPPGTGKTATVGAVVKKLESVYKFHFVSVNCYSAQSSSSLAKEVLSKLGHNDVTANRANRKLGEVFDSTKKPILILLDEVDNLQSGKSKQLLYTVFGWPAQFNGRVTVIGIANTLDLTQRQMSLLKLGTQPQLITFAAYTSEQLIAILEHRFANSERYDRKAMELCARKVSVLKGDVRLAFDIASQMLANLEPDDDDDDKENNNNGRDGAAAAAAAAADAKALLASKSVAQQKTPSKYAAGVSGRTPQKMAAAPALLRKGTPTAATPPRQRRCGTKFAEAENSGGISVSKEEKEEGLVTPKRTKFEEGSACREVLKAINKTMASPCQRARLPAQTRTLLATLMRLVSSSSDAAASATARCSSTSLRTLLFTTPPRTPRSGAKTALSSYCSNSASSASASLSVTRERLLSAYLTVCERLKLATPCPDEMDQMLILLESQSMVALQQPRGAKGGVGGQTRICFTVEMSIARAQINDNALINDIGQMDL